jgi:hypothetical protein
VNPCARVVNYAFYIPNGKTAESLYSEAITVLNNAIFYSFASSDCKAAVIELVCANTYLKCFNNVQLGNLSTYNYQAFGSINVGIPTTRLDIMILTFRL